MVTRLAVVSSCAIFCLLANGCGALPATDPATDFDRFILGTWEGESSRITTINGVQSDHPIKFRITIRKNGTFQLDEGHVNDSRSDITSLGKYQFVNKNTIKITGFEEEFVIVPLSENELTFDLTAVDQRNESVPAFIEVRYRRVSHE